MEAVTIILLAALAAFALALGAALWRSSRKSRRAKADDEGAYEIEREEKSAPMPLIDPFRGDAARVYYRQLLRAAERAGGDWTRHASETPAEYEVRLRSMLATTTLNDLSESGKTPEETAALADLTLAYRLARYKGDPTDGQRSEQLRGRLPRLLDALGGKPANSA